jgi:Rrf2 family transcriptional regulator, cysteine metabolism repressor
VKVSTKTRYGIRAAIELAQQYEKGPIQLRIIAERQEISVKYLEQLMTVLRSAGLVRSIRGAKGGYVLARSPRQVRMNDVFHCLEGKVVDLECIDRIEACNRAVDCAARGLWAKVEHAVDEVLRGVTLQDLADKAGAHARQDYEI